MQHSFICLFFFNDTATTEIYTLSLHDALPIFAAFAVAYRYAVWAQRPPTRMYLKRGVQMFMRRSSAVPRNTGRQTIDRKSTRLNSSHSQISYAVFCLKKKTQTITQPALHTASH